MAKKNGNILIVDDNRGVLTALQLLLKPYFEGIITLPSPVTLPSVLRERSWQVVLLDMNFTSGINTGNEGLYWLHEIKKQCPTLPVVLFTAYADIDLAVRGIKEGATDFVVKPWNNQKLVETLLNAVSASETKSPANGPNARRTAENNHPLADIRNMYWGNSSAMQQLRLLVEKVASTDANILITGENGTGKEMLAREIHSLSPRNRQDMVSVDMGAVTESLFESELFGHVKGSFTDAHADRAGKFEAAGHSTLFLDEIGNLPYHLQAKLLTAIQRRSIVRVGSNTPIPVDIRLICATNRNLPEMVAKGEFREDLLYRINTIHLEIPSLRERPEWIFLPASPSRRVSSSSTCERTSSVSGSIVNRPASISAANSFSPAVSSSSSAEVNSPIFSSMAMWASDPSTSYSASRMSSSRSSLTVYSSIILSGSKPLSQSLVAIACVYSFLTSYRFRIAGGRWFAAVRRVCKSVFRTGRVSFAAGIRPPAARGGVRGFRRVAG